MKSFDQAMLDLEDKVDNQPLQNLTQAKAVFQSDNVQSSRMNSSVQDLRESRRGMRELKSLVMSSAKGYLSWEIIFKIVHY